MVTHEERARFAGTSSPFGVVGSTLGLRQYPEHLNEPGVMEQVQRRIEEAAQRAREAERAFRKQPGAAIPKDDLTMPRSQWQRIVDAGRNTMTVEWPLPPMSPELLEMMTGGLLPAKVEAMPPLPSHARRYVHDLHDEVWLWPWQEELLREGLEQHGWRKA